MATFDAQVRVVVCRQCGAPLQASLWEPSATCRFCQTVNTFLPRHDESVFGEATPHPPIPEAERLDRLRRQGGNAWMSPSGMFDLLDTGSLAAWKVDEAKALWQAARQEVQTTGSMDAAERLLFLSVLLSDHYSGGSEADPLLARGLTESTLEVMTLPRHRQMLRGSLARQAAIAGDVAAAEQWLAACDQNSDDLQTDSAWRLSRGVIYTVRQDYAAVVTVLRGFPVLHAMAEMGAVFQANAQERTGDLAGATATLVAVMDTEVGVKFVREVISDRAALQLCPQSLPAALASPGVFSIPAGRSVDVNQGDRMAWPIGTLFQIISWLQAVARFNAVAAHDPNFDAWFAYWTDALTAIGTAHPGENSESRDKANFAPQEVAVLAASVGLCARLLAVQADDHAMADLLGMQLKDAVNQLDDQLHKVEKQVDGSQPPLPTLAYWTSTVG